MGLNQPDRPAMVADWAAELMLKPVSVPRTGSSADPQAVIRGQLPDWCNDDIATLSRVPEGGGGTEFEGRDDALNKIAFNAATDPSVDRDLLRRALIGAATINGFVDDEGPGYVERKIDHAFNDADNNMRPRASRGGYNVSTTWLDDPLAGNTADGQASQSASDAGNDAGNTADGQASQSAADEWSRAGLGEWGQASQDEPSDAGSASTSGNDQAGSGAAKKPEIRNGKWLSEQEFDDLVFAVAAIISEGAGLLVGPPKKGKSFFVADVALQVAAGGIALGVIPVEQRPVLYLALEDGWRRLQKRFRAMLRGRPIPEALEMIIKATPDEAFKAMKDFMTTHANEKPLVILDTLGKAKPPKKAGEESYIADYAISNKFKELAEIAPGSMVLVVHHTRKAEAMDFVDSVSGTQGIAGSFDFLLVLIRKRFSDDAILAVTGRDVIETNYALHADNGILWRLDGADLEAARDMVDKRRVADNMGDRMMDVYLEVLAAAGKPISAVETAGLLEDIDNDSVGKYLRRLASEGYIAKKGRGLYVIVESKKLSEVSETGENPSSDTVNDSDNHSDTLSEVSECELPLAGSPDGPPEHSDSSDTSDNPSSSDSSDRVKEEAGQGCPGSDGSDSSDSPSSSDSSDRVKEEASQGAVPTGSLDLCSVCQTNELNSEEAKQSRKCKPCRDAGR